MMKILTTLLALSSLVGAMYMDEVQPFSFNTEKELYPLMYEQFGAAVTYPSKVKLIPRAKGARSAFFLNQASLSSVKLYSPSSPLPSRGK